MNKVVTKKDKYAVVLSNLPYKIIHRIPRDTLSKPDPYNTIKNQGVKETDLSDYQGLEKLHTLPALGDQRPSELLASIRNLQPEPNCKCYCSRYQFLSWMPPITRAQLVSKKDLSLDELAALANDIMLSQTAINNLMAWARPSHRFRSMAGFRPVIQPTRLDGGD